MQLRHRLIMASAALATVFLSSSANAVNTFNNRAEWQSAAGTPQTITFVTDDAGNLLSTPPAEFPFGSLTLKGVTFMNGISAYNDYIYVRQGEVLRVKLPPNTTAFGLDWAFHAEAPGSTTFRLSSGEVFHPPPESIPYSLGHTFFGVTSDTPIEWVEFSLNSTALVIDNFSFVVPPMRVGIDIKPGSATNTVDSHYDGLIPIALLAAPRILHLLG
ncbi:MAG TPA: hypothetical protein VFF81_07715 [Noviherbaspirillum sp.]|nr:hypothetical protein [Noviherbaspirillum sp.]